MKVTASGPGRLRGQGVHAGPRLVLLLAWLRPNYRWVPAEFVRPAASTLLLALGAAAVLLLPWLIFGALGTLPQTLTALAQALSYGAGEELLLRVLIPVLLIRATGRPRLGFLLGLIIGFAMQPGYILPLADWMAVFRLFNVVAVGLLATAVSLPFFEAVLRGHIGEIPTMMHEALRVFAAR